MNLAPWQADAWRKLVERRSRGALAHALLLHGAAGVGKRVFADAFARALLCQSPGVDGAACETCRACAFFVAGTHPDLVRVNLELRDDGKTRTEIVVDQIRALSERLVLTAQFGGYQVAIIDPADALNSSASLIALLKTLEEPTANTILILVSDYPARLSATIRSRCQRIDFPLPTASVSLPWLQSQGLNAKQASDALATSSGNPGLALIWARSGTLALRDEVAGDLRALHQGKAVALNVANAWAKSEVDTRLWFAAGLARDEANAQARGVAGPLALTSAVDLTKLAAWFDQANRAREFLHGPTLERN